jgi:hypothetical protein
LPFGGGGQKQAGRRGHPALAATLLACASSIAITGGCQSSVKGPPLAKELSGDDPSAQIEFWHALPTRRAVGNDEAFHALLLLLDGADPAADYAGRVRAMTGRGLLPSGFAEPPDAAIRRGTLAGVLARALPVRGGLTMRLFGARDRYATREMEYAGLFPPSSPHQTFSGPEFLGIMGRVEDYQRGRSAEAQVPDELVAGPAGSRDAPGPDAAGGAPGVATPGAAPTVQPARY